jgi:hypothetical protein
MCLLKWFLSRTHRPPLHIYLSIEEVKRQQQFSSQYTFFLCNNGASRFSNRLLSVKDSGASLLGWPVVVIFSWISFVL